MKKLFTHALLLASAAAVITISPASFATEQKAATTKTTATKASPAKASAKKAEKKQDTKKQTTKKTSTKKSEAKTEEKTDEVKVVEETDQKFVRKFDGWDLFKIVDNSKKTCFITSSPTKEAGTFKKRGQAYALVTYHGRGTPEVSISSGYNYMENSKVEIVITGTKDPVQYEFFTSDKTPKVAWAKDAKTDSAIINSMKKGTEFVAKAESRAASTSEDTYSLKGFSAAVDGLIKFCK